MISTKLPEAYILYQLLTSEFLIIALAYMLVLILGYAIYRMLLYVLDTRKCEHGRVVSVELENGGYKHTCKNCRFSWEYTPIDKRTKEK